MKYKIQSQINNLDSMFVFAKEQEDDEVKAHLARYLCIRTSGLVESCLKLIISGYLQKKCPQPIENFVNFHINTLNNVKSEKISGLLSKFSSEWEEEYLDFTDGQLGESLNSVVGIRHSLAHNYNNPGITLAQLQNYWEDIKRIIDFLQELLK